MKDITWELKNLDSLKEYIFDELIGEHKNTKDINEAINTYAERYHEMQLKLSGSHNVSQRSELLAFRKWQKDNWKDVYLYSNEFMIREFKKANCG